MSDKSGQQVQYGIRLPKATLAQADKLATRMSRPGMRVTRADVIRLAVFHGFEQLEAEKTSETPKPARGKRAKDG